MVLAMALALPMALALALALALAMALALVLAMALVLALVLALALALAMVLAMALPMALAMALALVLVLDLILDLILADLVSIKKRRRMTRQKADVDHWSPGRLRHTRLTEIERKRGMDASRAVGGHKDQSTTEHYVKRDHEIAIQIAREEG